MVEKVKNPPANVGDTGDTGSIPELGRFPGGGHGNHSSVLAWRIPWTEGASRLPGLQRVGHNGSNSTHAHTHTIKGLSPVLLFGPLFDQISPSS